MGRTRVRVAVATAITMVTAASIALSAGVVSSQAGTTESRAVNAVAGFAAPVTLSSTGDGIGSASSVRWIGGPTTGSPLGRSLTVHNGDLVITQAGTVIDGLDIRGFVDVKAPGVVIKNSVIRGRNAQTVRGLVAASSVGTVLEDTEIAADFPWAGFNGIQGSGFTLRRVNIHHVVDPVHITGSNVAIEDSWFHDNTHYEQDPLRNNTPTHDDSVQIQAGSNIRISGTYFAGAHNAAVQITQDAGIVSDVAFTGNFLDNGACTINVAEKGKGAIRGISMADNVFGLNSTISRCSVVSPTSTVITMTRNLFSDGQDAVVKRGA